MDVLPSCNSAWNHTHVRRSCQRFARCTAVEAKPHPFDVTVGRSPRAAVESPSIDTGTEGDLHEDNIVDELIPLARKRGFFQVIAMEGFPRSNRVDLILHAFLPKSKIM